MQRLDLKSIRYDKLNRSVKISGRGVVLDISHEALELLANRPLDRDAAIDQVVEERKRLTRLAERLPADDGKINVTVGILANDAMFAEEFEERAR